jgi:hypothetical protein
MGHPWLRLGVCRCGCGRCLIVRFAALGGVVRGLRRDHTTRELQSKGCPSPSGQNSPPTRSTAQLQLFSVSLSITRSWESSKSPPLRPCLLQQLRALAIAALRIPTATNNATTGLWHRSPAHSKHSQLRHGSKTRYWHGRRYNTPQQRATTPPRRASPRLHENTTTATLARANDAVETAYRADCDPGVSCLQAGGCRLLRHGGAR